MTALVETRGLVKTHDTGGPPVVALDGVDLRIQRGEFVAVMGPSGLPAAGRYSEPGCSSTSLSCEVP